MPVVVIGSFGAEAVSDDQRAAALGVQIPQERVTAPDVVGKDLDRKTIRLEDLRGKVVLLNFWATWCIPCREEMPTMERLYVGRAIGAREWDSKEARAYIQALLWKME